MELWDGIVRLHPILDDLGCIPAHIKYMKLSQCADTIYLLRNQSYTCYIQYIMARYQWDPLGGVPGLNIPEKVVKNANKGLWTWCSISTHQ